LDVNPNTINGLLNRSALDSEELASITNVINQPIGLGDTATHPANTLAKGVGWVIF
jgi:hypothetical protein